MTRFDLKEQSKGGSIIILLSLLLFVGCNQSPYKKYESLVKAELASNNHADSLFLGVSLGMTSREFYMHCWDMNKKGIFTDGESNTAVLYKMREGLKFPASMNFYPNFTNDRVSRMGVSFRYDGWAPWNKHMNSDTLRADVIQLLEKWYPNGNPFIRMEDVERGVIHVKVDGNRRIIVGSYDNTYVKVVYTDLAVENQLTLN